MQQAFMLILRLLQTKMFRRRRLFNATFRYFQPRLVQAVFQGNYEEVETLLMKTMAANMSDNEKRTPLHAAAFRGFAEIAGKTVYKTFCQSNCQFLLLSKVLTPFLQHNKREF
jgi:hypothetical protein